MCHINHVRSCVLSKYYKKGDSESLAKKNEKTLSLRNREEMGMQLA